VPAATRRSVVVFAHDEAAHIATALDCIDAAGLGGQDRVTVLVNGSRDATAEIVARRAAGDSRIRAEVIALGDKANAWDHYVQTIADPAVPVHIFIDGDVRVSPGAFALIDAALAQHPEARAASCLPRGGRQSDRWQARILRDHGLPGNFYALRGEVLRRMKGRIWLPVGLIGDDTLLRWLVLRDLDPGAVPVAERIRPVPGAFFDYESFPFSNPGALWRRHMRYALREVQVFALWKRLERDGIAGLPRRIGEVAGELQLPGDLRHIRTGMKWRRLILPLAIRRFRREAALPLAAPAWDAAPHGDRAA